MIREFSIGEKIPIRSSEDIQSLISSRFGCTDVEIGDGVKFCISDLDIVRLGCINILRYTAGGLQRAHRRVKHIRQDTGDSVMLYLPMTAEVNMEQSGREARIMPGTFAFVDMTRPFSGALFGVDQKPSHTILHVRIPTPLLRERLPMIDDYCNKAFAIGAGAGNLMRSVIEAAIMDGAFLSEEHGIIFGRAVVDLIASAAQEWITGTSAQETISETSRKYSRERVISFIEANLSNPDLNTIDIAQKCNISVRYLHSIFENSGWTVSAMIREQRLLKCRAALQAPELHNRSVIEIAFCWGFNDASHFSRLYKGRFGYAPSEERKIRSN